MRKKRGYGLVYIMIFFTILIVMVSMLCTIVLQSGKNRKFYDNKRKELYQSEKGLERVERILGEYVENASDYALKNTDQEIERIFGEDLIHLEAIGRRLAQGENLEDIGGEELQLYAKDGSVNREKLKLKQDELTRRFYIEYYNNIYLGKRNLKWMLEQIESEEVVGAEGISISVSNRSEFENEGYTISDKFDLEIESLIDDGVKKRGIKCVFQFSIPRYSSTKNYPSQYIDITVNPVMRKGLVIQKKLEVYGDLKVNRGLYVRGEGGDGINIKSQDALLEVSGDIISGEGVNYNYDSSKNGNGKNGGKIKLREGNLFTRNIFIKGKENTQGGEVLGAKGSTLDVGGDVYVFDDLQIDGDNVKIKMDNYFGVSDGSSSKGNVVDRSSSIIINAATSQSNNSTVKIKGRAVIAGTSYIRNLENPIDGSGEVYQTGESTSIKGNYIAYSEDLENSRDLELSNGEVIDLKYNIGRTLLKPLTLATYIRKNLVSFFLFSENGKKKIFIDLDYDVSEKYAGSEFLVVDGYDMRIKIGEKVEIPEDKYVQLALLETIQGDFQDEDGAILYEDVKLSYLRDNLKAVIYSSGEDFWLRVEKTNRGLEDDDIELGDYYRCDLVHSQDDRLVFGKYYAISGTFDLNNNITVDVLDIFGNIVSSESLEIKIYDEEYNNLRAREKSVLFSVFNEEFSEENKIRGKSIISIVDVSRSIFLGAVVANNTVIPGNYYNDPLENEIEVKFREDVLKDKLFFMDMFEKKFSGEADNPYGNRNLEDFNMIDHKEQYLEMVTQGKTTRNFEDYEIDPNTFIDFDNWNGVIDDIPNLGLYLNSNDEAVLISDNQDSLDREEFQGDTVLIDSEEEGIIVVKGDLYLSGNISFSGTIVALGNVFIERESRVDITYNEAVVADIISKQREITKRVFKEHFVYKNDKKGIVVLDGDLDDTRERILRIIKWVVIK